MALGPVELRSPEFHKSVSTSLSKAIAFKACGESAKAAAWAARLVQQLELAEILNVEAVARLPKAN